MKKIYILLILFFLVFIPFSGSANSSIFAEESITTELTDEIDEQLNNLDLTGIEKIIANMTENEKNLFGTSTFWGKLKSILNGDYAKNGQGIVSAILSVFFDELLEVVPTLALIVAISLLFGMVSLTKPNFKSHSIKEIIHFVCYGSIIIIVIKCVCSLIANVGASIEAIKVQMEVIFPLLLTLLAAIGGVSSVAVYQPAFALLTCGMLGLFSKILLPLFICILVFNLLSNLTSTVKFEKFASFFTSIYKWLIGLSFTVFYGFVAIRGVSAGTYDNISFKTAKFAIKSSVPFVGGYISDGLNLVLASGVLIKNSIGIAGLLVLFATVIFPLLELVVFMFGLKLVSAILEPLTDSRISNFISAVAKTISLLIALMVAIIFMYVLLVGLVMLTANFY